jgi:hemoglobin/transferrin/lactoferrin receptor protein
LFDFFYTQSLGERTRLRAGLNNITDRTYWNWSQVRGLSPDDPVIPYLAQAGRSVSLSLNLRW